MSNPPPQPDPNQQPYYPQRPPSVQGQMIPSPYPPPPPPENQGKRILGVSLGVFLGIAGAVVFLCCLVPAGVLIFGGVIGGIEEATTPDPQVAILSCEVDDAELLPTAEVEWEITNPDNEEGFWTVHITVLDSQGRQVGETFDGGFGIAPGATEVSQVTVFLDASGAETCEITVDS